jgi:hypothetical protein
MDHGALIEAAYLLPQRFNVPTGLVEREARAGAGPIRMVEGAAVEDGDLVRCRTALRTEYPLAKYRLRPINLAQLPR